MSDMHVLVASNQGIYNIVMHFEVPDVNNLASINYRTALVNSGIGGTTSLEEGTGAGQITITEKAQVLSGEIYEYSVDFNATGNGSTTVAIRDSLRSFYAREKTRIIDNLQYRLKRFGYEESGS